MNKYVQIIKNILGEDFFEELKKSEIGSGIFKPDTKTALDPSEIKIALQIVPKTILSFLIFNLKHLDKGSNIDLPLPFADAVLHVNKISNDVYTGDIVSKGKRITEFKYRSLPGIGLILMSTFELYDMDDLGKIRNEKTEDDKIDKLQDIIDERLKLNALVRSVVDQRISEREAIQQIVNDRLSEQFEYEDEEEEEESFEEPLHSEEEDSVEILEDSKEDIMDSQAKKSKLKEFLDNREKKRQEQVELDKSEIGCPDCGTNLYKGEGHFKLCICYGENYNKEIKIKKTQDGKFDFKFPKSFDTDNVEMLLEAIKSNKLK
jgi:hypothetical protein